MANIMVRLNPGIEAHTHEFVQTGKVDAKFGFPLVDMAGLIKKIKAAGSLKFLGVHAHIGSQIFDAAPFVKEVEVLVSWAAKFNQAGLAVQQIDLGGGIGVSYIDTDDAPAIEEFAAKIVPAFSQAVTEAGLSLPTLILEPGRSIVGEAGVTIYRVGAVKEIAGIRKYVIVDGGMSDNPRPILYGAQYKVLAPHHTDQEEREKVTVAGRFCESGDVLFKDIYLPKVKKGDLLAVFCTGAYNYAMASNYNRVPRPGMVLVGGGKATVIIKRETYKDLIRNDILI
jgi:diaminopimelate decarboxylase